MINTHEKLFKEFIDLSRLHEYLRLEGYDKGEGLLLDALIFAIRETDLYLYESNLNEDEKLSEEEYFQMLINKMNYIV